jgi:hypothetical protein
MMRRTHVSREDGMTIPEMMVAVLIGFIVCLGLFTFLDNTSKSSERTAARVDAAKLGRPVMARIMDRLHSTCVAPGVAPVLAGSTGQSISFVHKTGTDVSVTPDKRVITYDDSQHTLTETAYAATSGAAPTWTFSTTPLTPGSLVLLRNVYQQVPPGTSTAIPVFQYYAFNASGQISTAPLPVPLSASNAAKVVQVTVTFAVAPRSSGIIKSMQSDEMVFTDSAIFRFTPPGESASTENLPCA